MKCFVCGKQYDPNNIEGFSFWESQELHTVLKVNFKNKDIPLCSTCLRQTMLSFCMKEHYDIQIEDINE